MKLNNRGMTLVEMIVAFAILGLVSASIFSMMLTGTKTYTKLTNTVKLQYDAQLATANIEKRILNCDEGFEWDGSSLILVEDGTAHVLNWNASTGEFKYGTGPMSSDEASLNMYLLAEHVTAFRVDVQTTTEESVTVVQRVEYEVKLERNGQSYTRGKAVALRNLPPLKDYTVTMN